MKKGIERGEQRKKHDMGHGSTTKEQPPAGRGMASQMVPNVARELADNIHSARVLGGRCPRCRLQGSRPLVPEGHRVIRVEVMKPLPDTLTGCNGSTMVADVVAHLEPGGALYVFISGGRGTSLRDRIVMRSLGANCVVSCNGVRMSRCHVVSGAVAESELVVPWIDVGDVQGTICDGCAATDERVRDEERDREEDSRMRDESIMRRRAETATRLWNSYRPEVM